MNYLLEVNKIGKAFGDHQVFQDVSFALEPGEIVGLVGRNGVGKTTLMKCILGLTSLDQGEVRFREKENFQKDKAAMDEIGYLLDCKLFEQLNAYENIKIQEWYRGNRYSKQEEKRMIEDVLARVDLKNDAKKVKEYSFGMKQRLGLALSLLGNTKLLILDEPFVGLDPVGLTAIRDFIIRISQEKEMAILISSHQLAEIEEICQRYLFIRNKQVIPVDQAPQKTIHLELDKPLAESLQKSLDPRIMVKEAGLSFAQDKDLLNQTLHRLVRQGSEILDIRVEKASLNDLFKEEA